MYILFDIQSFTAFAAYISCIDADSLRHTDGGTGNPLPLPANWMVWDGAELVGPSMWTRKWSECGQGEGAGASLEKGLPHMCQK